MNTGKEKETGFEDHLKKKGTESLNGLPYRPKTLATMERCNFDLDDGVIVALVKSGVPNPFRSLAFRHWAFSHARRTNATRETKLLGEAPHHTFFLSGFKRPFTMMLRRTPELGRRKG